MRQEHIDRNIAATPNTIANVDLAVVTTAFQGKPLSYHDITHMYEMARCMVGVEKALDEGRVGDAHAIVKVALGLVDSDYLGLAIEGLNVPE